MPVQKFKDKAVLQHPSGSSAEVYYYGANVTSWKYDGKERLFLSKKSKLDGTRAIRGGIPLVFPQFGKASDPSAETATLPQHGFARSSNWDLSEVTNDDESKVSVEFVLTDSQVPPELISKWPKKFKLTFVVTLTKETLENTFIVKNEETKDLSSSFNFHSLLHTYFSVPDILKVKIHDLNNITYTDKVANGAKFLEKEDVIKIDKHTDRVYIDVPASKIHIDTGEEKFIVTKINCKDTVVWNPWIEWSKATTDIDDEEYKGMVCVEVGQVTDYVNLKAQETWKCGQILEVAANVS